MNEKTTMIMIGITGISGIIILFMISSGITGAYMGAGGYKSDACTKVIPDTTLSFEKCWVDAQRKCEIIHPKYISPTDKFNKCYNTCVFYARSMCYK